MKAFWLIALFLYATMLAGVVWGHKELTNIISNVNWITFNESDTAKP